jgi:general L-amino acid transport system permease protein
MSDTHAPDCRLRRATRMLRAAGSAAFRAGAIKWMRENLFSGWFNILLTVSRSM